MLAQPVGQLGELGPAGLPDPDPLAVGQPDRVQQLAVDVELELVGGAVADPHRLGAGIALPVLQGLLLEVRGAVDPVHDLQRPRRLTHLLGGTIVQPAPEGLGLLGEPEPEQGVNREGAVPDPGEAVVPVALAPDLLGQPSGRGGHQGAGGRVGQQLQGDRRAVDLLTPAAPVGRAGQPATPEPRRVGEQAEQLLGGHGPRWAVGGRLQHHPPGLAGAHGQGAGHVVAVALHRPLPRAVQGQLQGRGAEHRPVVGELQLMRLPAVVEPGRALEHKPHLAAHAPHHPDQPVPVAGPLGVVDRHEVGHLADPVGGHEPGDQDGGVGKVQLPGDVVVALGADAETPAVVVVEQRGEHTRRVEPRAAEPVDGAVGGDQRRGLEVSDQPVLGDWRITIHGRSLPTLACAAAPQPARTHWSGEAAAAWVRWSRWRPQQAIAALAGLEDGSAGPTA